MHAALAKSLLIRNLVENDDASTSIIMLRGYIYTSSSESDNVSNRSKYVHSLSQNTGTKLVITLFVLIR